MKICIAQTRPLKGNIKANIENHLRLAQIAVANKADLIIFPELSLTGYEPNLGKALATDQDDKRFSVFQALSDKHGLTIGVGIPARIVDGVRISMVIFQKRQPPQLYSKEFLHADEEPFFISGGRSDVDLKTNSRIALAICYEISVPEHAERAHSNGAEIYIASVAKSVSGIERALKRLSDIAGEYKMPALMSNCVGICDG